MAAPVRVLLVDDSAPFVETAREILDADPRMEVVGVAADGDEAIELAERLTPDLVLMDIEMPRLNGVEATRAIRDRCPTAHVVMLTGRDERAYEISSGEAGAGSDHAREELYEELARLPERYRAPLVLCYLEGLSNEHAASRLRLPLRTFQRRLSQGKERLRVRLLRRGLFERVRNAGRSAPRFPAERGPRRAAARAPAATRRARATAGADRERRPVLEIGITEILKILPHRYPFLLVDRIPSVEPGKRVVGIKNVSYNEEFFQGHFPGNPVMPGVLVVEAMAHGVVPITTTAGGMVDLLPGAAELASSEYVDPERIAQRIAMLSRDREAYARAARDVLAHQRAALTMTRCTDDVVRTLLA